MRNTASKRRGVTGVSVAITLPILVGMAALAVDVGYMCTRGNEMQNAVDSGALAGASALLIDDATVRARGVQFAGSNPLGPETVAITADDVEIGNWEWYTKSFTASPTPGIRSNAVRAIGRRDGLPLFFAGILGHSEANVLRDAIALMDSGRCLGVWGLEGVVASGDVITDSYDSRTGLYGSSDIHQNGDICSNEDILINGGVVIRGDAMYGPGHDITIHGGSGEIWGLVGGICCPAEPPLVDASAARTTNDNDTAGTNQDRLSDNGFMRPAANNKVMLVSDDNLTLWGGVSLENPGTYYFSSATMVGQSTMTIGGPTVIYIDGDGTLTGGGLINTTQDPRNLIIYCTGNDLKLSGNAAFYGAVVAPNADITLQGTSDYYGTIIGRTITAVGDFVLHVDEAVVADIMGGDGDVVPVLVE